MRRLAMVSAVSIKCPDCNASLELVQGRNTVFCQYCGAKIILFNENEHVYKHIDEAGIKYAETERIIKLKELELLEKKEAQKKRYIIIWLSIIGVLGLLAIIMGLSGKEMGAAILGMVAVYIGLFGAAEFSSNGNDKEKDKIVLPMSISRYKDMDYHIVEAELRRAGFYNIRCIELCDLKTGFFNSQDQVALLSVDGNQSVVAGQKYLPEVPIVITYHSFGKR